jgi:hypothetical protein
MTMIKAGMILIAWAVSGCSVVAQTVSDSGFNLALPDHKGRLSWSADGFSIVEYSAKPGGREIDDSFLPYRDNKKFWAFLEELRTKQ